MKCSWIYRTGVAFVVLLLLGACGASSDRMARPTVGTYHQTWRKQYATTMCRDWTTEMNAHERFVMSGDMLLAVQRHDDSQAPLPPDSQINTMRDAIQGVCSGPPANLGRRIADVAVSLYMTSDDLKAAN